MSRRPDVQVCIAPVIAVFFVAALIHVMLTLEPEPPQYTKDTIPPGKYRFVMPEPMMEFVLPKSPLLDYPTDGFDWTNYPVSAKRNVTRYYLETPDAAQKPVVSVVTLVNSAGAVQHINESLKALMQQSLQDFEWMIWVTSVDLMALVKTAIAEGRPGMRNSEQPPIYLLYSPKAVSLIEHLVAVGGFTNASLVYHLAVDSMPEPTAIEKLYWLYRSHEGKTLCAVSGLPIYIATLHEKRLQPAVGFQLGDLMLERYTLPTEMLWRKEEWMSLHAHAGVPEASQFWYNWLIRASEGRWGRTVEEHLSWERLEWQTWKWNNVESTEGGRRALRPKFQELFKRGMRPPPDVPPTGPAWVRGNVLRKNSQHRVLILVDNVTASLSNPLLDVIAHVQRAGLTVTLVALRDKSPSQLYITSDLFFLSSFLPRSSYAPFILYLCASRFFDSVLLVGAVPAFIATAIRHTLPHASVLQYLPLGTAASVDAIPEVPALRELPNSAANPPLLPLSHWASSPSERTFQRQNYLLRTDTPLFLVRLGNISLGAANDSLHVLAALEASTTLAATVVILRDRMSSMEPWSSTHPLFRYNTRNSTTGSVRLLIISAHDPQVYHAWMKTADGMLLMESDSAEALTTWHRIALAGGCLVVGPRVPQVGLPESVVRSQSAPELLAKMQELIRTGAVDEKQRTRDEMARRQAGSLDKLVEGLRAGSAVLHRLSDFNSAYGTETWVERHAAEAGWKNEERAQQTRV